MKPVQLTLPFCLGWCSNYTSTPAALEASLLASAPVSVTCPSLLCYAVESVSAGHSESLRLCQNSPVLVEEAYNGSLVQIF